MKKNTMMRVASALLVAVLLSTSVISGTFAKYTTSANATDSARVAKWGVTVTASSDEVFTPTYASETTGVTGNTVVAATNADNTQDDLLAPGTSGLLGSINISGQPEVMVKIEVTADLTLTGWVVGEEVYCPIVFTVGNEEIKMGGDIDTLAELEAAVEAKFTALAADAVAAGTSLGRSVSVSWAWAYDDATNSGSNDAKDTALGNLTGDAVPTIVFEYTATVTQID